MPRLRGRRAGEWHEGALLVVLGLFFAACGSSVGAGSGPSPTPPEARTATPASPASAAPSPAPPIRVAAAADLRFALDDVVAAWGRAHAEAPVEPTYGSSGSFFAQIQQGAPFDLYFSADIDYPRRLAAAGLADGATLRAYAIGQIVVWVPTSSPLDVEATGLAVLAEPTVQKVAIANPEHAPYGRAAIAALESFGLTDVVRPKLVLGENVSQAAQFVDSGNADAGIIALSLAKAPTLRGRGRYAVVPLGAYPRIEQGAVVLAGSDRAATARAFLDFVLGPEGRAILDAYGFMLP